MLVAMVACTDSGSTDNGGGTADAGTPFPHGWCPGYGVGTYPPGIGTKCAAGSNKPICASKDTAACPDSEYCVWHAADVEGAKAYCTAVCDASDPQSCPAGYTCQKEECDGRSVCLRTGKPPPADGLKHRVEEGKPPVELGEQGIPSGAGALSDGTSYWSLANGYILKRASDGTWSVAHKPKLVSKNLQAFSLYELEVVDGAAYAYGAGGWLIRIAPENAPKHEVLFNLEGRSLPCDGEDSGGITDRVDDGCESHRTLVAVVFRTASGEVRALTGDAEHVEQEVYRREPGGKWSLVGPAQKEWELSSPHPLSESGFVANCERKPTQGQGLCFSEDGLTVKQIGTASNETGFNADAVGGTSGRDIWGEGTVDGKSTLRHYDGTVWTVEKIDARRELSRGGVWVPQRGTVLLMGTSFVLTHEDGCWKAVRHKAPYDRKGRGNFGVTLPNGSFAFDTLVSGKRSYYEIIGAFNPR